MTSKRNLLGAHLTPLQVTAVVGTNSYENNAAAAVTLLGTTQAGAVQLGYDVNNVTGASNTGGLLPQSADTSDTCFVANSGANTIKIYPATATGTINGGAAGAAVTIATLKAAEFRNTGGGDNWYYVVTG